MEIKTNPIPLKYNFFYHEGDIFYKDKWLCRNFITFQRISSRQRKVEKIESKLLSASAGEKKLLNFSREIIIKVKDKIEIEPFFIQSIDLPIIGEENTNIVVPIEFIINNRKEFYDFISPYIEMTDCKTTRNKLRDYLLFHNYIWEKKHEID